MKAIVNAKIHTMAGQTIENGQLLMDRGKIKEVGKNLQIPDQAQVIDAQGRMLTPGIVDPHSHIGVGEEGIGAEGRDYNETSDPISPHMRAIDGIYPMDQGFIEAYQAGVSTVVTGPGSANIIGGTFLAMKTYGRRVDDMVIKDPVAMKMAFGENPKRVYGSQGKAPVTRMGTMAMAREAFYKALDYMEKKEGVKRGQGPSYDAKMEALIPVLKGELMVKAHAHRSDDIFTAIRLAKEFNFKMTLDHCTEGHLIADLLVEEGYPCICGPNLSSASKYELKNRSFVTPARLHEAGLKVAIMTDNSVIPTPQITIAAGLAHKSGLPEEEAFKAISINAAQITGIEDRVGSIEPGKDADLVIWSKNPIKDIDCQADYTFIDGRLVYQNGVDEKIAF